MVLGGMLNIADNARRGSESAAHIENDSDLHHYDGGRRRKWEIKDGARGDLWAPGVDSKKDAVGAKCL